MLFMEHTNFKTNTVLLWLGTVILVGGAVLLTVNFFGKKDKTAQILTSESRVSTEQTSTVPIATGAFATYQEIPVKINPQVAAYTVNADLSNVTNAADFNFSPEAKALLVKNAFVVERGYRPEFFPLYESNRYEYISNFVTTDSLLHNYHLMFDHILRKLEETKLENELTQLNATMLAEAERQHAAAKGTAWEKAATRNVAFFAVGSRLLDPNIKIPNAGAAEVAQELKLIEAHAEIELSPVMNIGQNTETSPVDAAREDYSQYIPRGHYTKTEPLQRYFQSMMWYGRQTFRLQNDDEIKSAVLITLALKKDQHEKNWHNIYEPVNFLVGKSDDITYEQFREVLEKTYGAKATVAEVIAAPDRFAALVKATENLAPPQINSIPIFNAEIQPDREKVIKGFRFMGQRFTIDAAIFQRLIEREVKNRFLPKGLDIPAALGSTEALALLQEMGETNYENYPENMAKMKAHLAGLPAENWTQNVYWGWLNALRTLLIEPPTGYPSFMRNQAWVRKNLHTFLGSWTELKHDTILYAKQVYAEMGGGAEPGQKDDRGYVEPNPYVYARLASLLNLTRDGLQARGLLDADMKDNLSKLEQLARSLKTISEKELENKKLSDAEYELIRTYGGQLEHFWLEVNKDDIAKQTDKSNYLDQNPAALIADVATDPNGEVLEEATGHIGVITVIVPVEGKLKMVRGGVYSYYEFPWPLSDRLTDEKWRQMLDSGKAPKGPAWTQAFLSDNE